MVIKSVLFLQILLGINLCVIAQERLAIYQDVLSFPCTILTDQKGPIGCRSSRNGNSAPLWPLETQQDVEDFIDKPPSSSRIVAMESLVFTKTNVDNLIKTKKVTGIVVAAGPKPQAGFSPVSSIPLQKYGIDPHSTFEWNPIGSNFAYQYYDLPIFALDGNQQYEGYYSSEHVMDAARENKAKKGSFPQWGVSLNSFMHSTGNAEVCLRRSQCQPLGGKSVWSALGPIDTNKDIIFTTATLDANAFFHDLATGANAYTSGVIATMAAIRSLTQVDKTGFNKQLVFGFFTGESWGYLGSNRFVYDITKFVCNKEDTKNKRCNSPYKYSLAFQNIKLNKISSVIDVSQVGKMTSGVDPSKLNLYVHQQPSQSTSPNDNILFKTLQDVQNRANISVSFANIERTGGIPPSPLVAFLKANPNLLGVVLAEHQAEFTNNYYQSRFDDYDNTELSSVCQTGTLLAHTLWSLATGNSTGPFPAELTVDCGLVDTLMQCFTKNMNCTFGRDYIGEVNGFLQPSQYVSVYRQSGILSLSAGFLYSILFDWTAYSRTGSCKSNKDCPEDQVCMKSMCLASETYYHDALSLAFERDGVSWKIVNPDEPTWTESNWDATFMTMFLMDSPTTEVVMFIFGILNILLSFGVVWYLRNYLSKVLKGT